MNKKNMSRLVDIKKLNNMNALMYHSSLIEELSVVSDHAVVGKITLQNYKKMVDMFNNIITGLEVMEYEIKTENINNKTLDDSIKMIARYKEDMKAYLESLRDAMNNNILALYS